METHFQKLKLIAKTATAAIAACSLFAAGACATDQTEGNSSNASSDGNALTVFVTTGYLSDAVHNIAPDANLVTMIGPGGDPHSYQPTTKDIAAMKDADVVFWNGLGLEESVHEQLESLGDKQVAVGESIPKDMLLPWTEDEDTDHDHDHESEAAHEFEDADHDHEGESGHHHDHSGLEYDPHVWNSTENWKIVVDTIVDKLSAVDTEHAADYRRNGDAYKGEIDEAAAYVKDKIAEIPAESRTLISGHDAFAYFGHEFGLEVRATDFVSSEAQLSAAQLVELAQYIADHKVRTIFQDNVSNPQAIESLKERVQADGWETTVSDQVLYSDALGTQSPQDTYLGALKYNADTISAALK